MKNKTNKNHKEYSVPIYNVKSFGEFGTFDKLIDTVIKTLDKRDLPFEYYLPSKEHRKLLNHICFYLLPVTLTKKYEDGSWGAENEEQLLRLSQIIMILLPIIAEVNLTTQADLNKMVEKIDELRNELMLEKEKIKKDNENMAQLYLDCCQAIEDNTPSFRILENFSGIKKDVWKKKLDDYLFILTLNRKLENLIEDKRLNKKRHSLFMEIHLEVTKKIQQITDRIRVGKESKTKKRGEHSADSEQLTKKDATSKKKKISELDDFDDDDVEMYGFNPDEIDPNS